MTGSLLYGEEWNRLDLYEKSNNDIMIELGQRFRDYRIALRMTQKEIALQSGVSVMTIVRFEKGKGAAIRLDNFISLMRSIQKLEEGVSKQAHPLRSGRMPQQQRRV